MEKKIKILQIQSRICIGGPAIHTEILCKYINPDRFESILVGGALEKGEQSRIEVLKQQGIRVEIMEKMGRKLSVFNDLYSVYWLYRFIKSERPQIVNTHTAKAGAVGRIAAWLARVPVIIHTFHGHVFYGYFNKWKTAFYLFLERFLAKISTQIIVISRSQYEDIVLKFKIAPEHKVTLIPLGIELERFLKIKKIDILKKQLNLKPDAYLLAIIGRMVPVKNHLMSLLVLRKLIDENLPVHLLMVGHGELFDEIQLKTKELNLEEYVHFSGWSLDIENTYAGIDALLLTSLNEGTPITLLEAMASGVPVIATAVGGVTDLISDDQSGYLCEVNNIDEMVLKIKKVLFDPGMTQQIIANAKSNVQNRFSYQRLIGEVEDFYSNFIKD
ncbi:glycosyltransferase family 4 protein [candidate division KSB1 bacterium]|nr:glycosyltransferase family 4 protein [candidate division KSB1 bacterium]